VGYHDDDDDDSDPDSVDMDEDEGDGTVPCPFCGEAVYEEADVCRHCGNHISSEDVRGRTPIWIVVGVIVCLGVVVFLWLR
jgi:predicted nucleic acid-binding Zn ribbon protein